MLVRYSGEQVRRLSSAPQSARLMIVGAAAAAFALAAGVAPTEASAALVPPSTKVASTRARAPSVRPVTRTCTCSDPATPTGSVATLAWAASALPGTGAASLSPTGVQLPQRPS